MTAEESRPTPLPVRVDGIPESLRAERRFVIWKSVQRDGRWTKPPLIATANEQLADSTDPTTWRTFAEAHAAYEDGKCDGIGFVLGDGWVGFDADDTDAPEFLQLLNTYSERSPSGRGVHAIARGTKPGTRSRVGPYELYDRDRYFTVTGDHIPGTPTTVEDRTPEIAAVYARLFPNGNGAAHTPVNTTTSTLTDDDLIAKAGASLKSGVRFKKLWAGDISDYPSHSEADLALCSFLAFWSNRDAAQMDRLFRKSKLMRPKWDERRGDSTIGKDLVDKAIASTTKGFTQQASRVEFLRASEVSVVKIDWLWRARLAKGAITLVEGGPERGKSTILADLAARVTQGHSFPGETDTREPSNVVMLIAEDDIAATVVPRLMAAGADLTRIYFLSVTKDERGDVVPFHLGDDCERLRARCQEVGNVTLVIVDPLVSFMGSRTGRTLNTYNDMEVRKALAPLKQLAEVLRVSVAAIRHFRKGASTNAMEAGGGSVAFAALVRVVIAALPDPDDEMRYLLAVSKNNLVKKSERPALAYEIVPWEADADVGRIAWGGAVEMSANEILAAQAEADKDGGKVAEAREFLETFLADGTWKATKEILAAAKAHGIKESAIERAKKKLPIGATKKDGWGWTLASPPPM